MKKKGPLVEVSEPSTHPAINLLICQSIDPLIHQFAKRRGIKIHFPRCKHQVRIFDKDDSRLQEPRKSKHPGDIAERSPRQEYSRDISHLVAQITASVSFTGSGRTMHQDAPLGGNVVGSQNVATCVQIDHVALQKLQLALRQYDLRFFNWRQR